LRGTEIQKKIDEFCFVLLSPPCKRGNETSEAKEEGGASSVAGGAAAGTEEEDAGGAVGGTSGWAAGAEGVNGRSGSQIWKFPRHANAGSGVPLCFLPLADAGIPLMSRT